MIFISDDFRGSRVFSASLVNPFVGDPMIKLIASALLSVGIATAAMAADVAGNAYRRRRGVDIRSAAQASSRNNRQPFWRSAARFSSASISADNNVAAS